MMAFGLVCTAVIGLAHGEPRGALALLRLPAVLEPRTCAVRTMPASTAGPEMVHLGAQTHVVAELHQPGNDPA